MHLNIDADPEKFGLQKDADGYAIYDDEWYVFDTLKEALDEYISESIDMWDLENGKEVILMSTTRTYKPWEEGDYTHVPNKKVKVKLAITAEIIKEIKVKTDRNHKMCQDCPLKELDPPKCDCNPTEHFCHFKPPFA